jgi:hypothetical protein
MTVGEGLSPVRHLQDEEEPEHPAGTIRDHPDFMRLKREAGGGAIDIRTV